MKKKRLLAGVLSVALLAGLLPTSFVAAAAQEPVTTVLACSDFQAKSGHEESKEIVREILDAMEEDGLIFLYGHNHSNGWDAYLGGAAVYLEKGDSILIAQNNRTDFKEETLHFTYMNPLAAGHGIDVKEFEVYGVAGTPCDTCEEKMVVRKIEGT